MGAWLGRRLSWILRSTHNTIPNSNTYEAGWGKEHQVNPHSHFPDMIHKVNIGGGWFGMGLGCHVTRIPGHWLVDFYKKVKSKSFCLPSFKFKYKQKSQSV